MTMFYESDNSIYGGIYDIYGDVHKMTTIFMEIFIGYSTVHIWR